jgi:antitoxin component YwqK of YwqJK toxin-antitoxin module
VAERFFTRDVPSGTWREWYPDGTPRSEVEFGTASSDELLTSRYWHANGTLAAEGCTRGGLREGEWTYQDVDGRLQRRGGYRAGLRDGDWLFLRPDGSKEAAGRYAQGQRVGEWILWDEDGTPHTRPAAESRDP